ncbi:unnamed protein product [Rotaria sordida]|uniref:Uncharacterized protein n=1 Tax=Rotaria sordida TaxID=392033 RepID=A0A814SWN0_9BILA|nr:unnamed protein product [Rotaria sordida]
MAVDNIKHLPEIQKTIDDLKIYQSNNDQQLTNQYGYIAFNKSKVDSTSRLSQYIRLALTTDAEKVVQFMHQGWCLPTPDLIISVTGGAKHFDMSPRLRNIFQMGLVDAAATTNAWIITTGTNAGVVQEVGEALNNYRYIGNKQGLDIPCIGIASWNYIADNSQLEITNPANSTRIQSYIVRKSPKGKCHLEPNHTHFLLFDDGKDNPSSVLGLRARIEMLSRDPSLAQRSHVHQVAYGFRTENGITSQDLITTQSTHMNTMQLPPIEPIWDTLIPIVMVLLEGGASSLNTVSKALKENTPIVVVKESGRAADFVAYVYEYFSNTNDHAQHQPSDDISIEVQKNHSWISDIKHPISLNELNDLYETIRTHKEFVTIFNFNSEQYNGNLDDAILEAVLNAAKVLTNRNNNYSQTVELKLAMAWNKFDYAKKKILTDTIISKWKKEDLQRALVDALRRGHVDFVELLIELGASPAKLTVDDLERLYVSASIGSSLPCGKKKRRTIATRKDFYKAYLLEEPKLDKDQNTKNTLLGEYGLRDLFIWAIFLDRVDLATYFCSKTWNPLVAPLIAAWIYQRARSSTLNSELKEKYHVTAETFDGYARSIIDHCFDNNKMFAIKLLKGPIATFYNAHPLKRAREANCRKFIASPCVQRYLNNLWFGHINYHLTWIDFRVFLCTLFIPLLPFGSVFLPYVRRSNTSSTTVQPSLSTNFDANTVSTELSNQPFQPPSVQWYQKIGYFYAAPIVRFYYNVIFFILFLGLFSYVYLVDYFPLNIYHETRSGYYNLLVPIPEIMLHICLWSVICEEIYQVVHKTLKGNFITDLWNILAIIAIGLYVVGFITRFIVSEAVFTVSKIFMGLDLIVWYIRILHLFAAYERLGPKLEMIFKTIKDLLFFVCFIVIFLLGFSITSWSLINTTSQVNWTYTGDGQLAYVTTSSADNNLKSWQTLRDVINYGVWKIFGQVDPITDTNAYSNVAFVLAIIFVTIANVLLLSLLVALFNVTIQNVTQQSYVLWRYQRFLLVDEYKRRSLLPPPFNIFYYIVMVVRCTYLRISSYRKRHMKVSTHDTIPSIRIDADTDIDSQSELEITDDMKRERAIVSHYWAKTFKNQKKDRNETK